LSKSEIIPIGEVEDVERLAGIFGCRVVVLPMTYLGLPLGVPYKSITIWNGIVDGKAVGGLEEAIFVKGGRLTLIQSTLSNLPTCYLSLFPIQLGVASRIEKLQRDFL
jgi:hypothetical protein